MLPIAVLVLGGFVMAVTLLSLLRAKAWWIRVWNFPRFQLAVAGVASLAATSIAPQKLDPRAR